MTLNLKTVKINLSILALSLITLHTASFAQADDREARHAAFEECASEAGMEKPAAGQRPTAPTDEQKAALDACMKEKGFQPPSRFGGGGPGGPRQPSSDSSSSSSAGVQ